MFGRKKKSYVVSLSFERYDFPHLVGMQYANDVDFKIPLRREPKSEQKLRQYSAEEFKL